MRDRSSALLFLAVVLGFGTAFALNATAVRYLHPLWVAAGRAGIALVILGGWAVLRGARVDRSARGLGVAVVLGLLTAALPWTLLAWGQRHVPSALAGIVFAGVPLMTLLLGAVLFDRARPGALALTGAGLGLAGVAMALPLDSLGRGPKAAGAIAVLLAAMSYAVGGLIVQARGRVDMLGLTAAQLVPATMFLAVAALIGPGLPEMAALARGAAPVAVLGLTGTALPLASLFVLIGREGATAASSTTFLIPFVAVAAGVLALGETLAAQMEIGFALAVLGSLLTRRRSGRP